MPLNRRQRTKLPRDVISYGFTDGQWKRFAKTEILEPIGWSKGLRARNAALLAKRGDVTVNYNREDPMNAKLYPFRYF
jgi:hypothetical protein